MKGRLPSFTTEGKRRLMPWPHTAVTVDAGPMRQRPRQGGNARARGQRAGPRRGRATGFDRAEKKGQRPCGPAEARGEWAGWVSGPKPGREKKNKELSFLL
jgi:hypothetical protein